MCITPTYTFSLKHTINEDAHTSISPSSLNIWEKIILNDVEIGRLILWSLLFLALAICTHNVINEVPLKHKAHTQNKLRLI